MAVLDVIYKLLALVLLAGVILVYREEAQNNRYRFDFRESFIVTDTRTGTIYVMPPSSDAVKGDKWTVLRPPTSNQPR